MRTPFFARSISLLSRVLGRAPPPSPWDGGMPIREELFGVERMEQHARSLANAQTVTERLIPGHPLAERLAENGAVLLAAYRGMVAVIEEGGAITPAAEWLIDNYFVIERQIREILSNLPPGYYRQLPKLAGGPFAGYPRVFGMTWAYVAHGDSRFDPAMLIRYVRAYQDIQPLTIGELWAVSTTLRIVLIENLRRVAQQILEDRSARQQANDLADRLLDATGHDVKPVETILPQNEGTRLAEAFAVQLVHRLRDQDPRITPALTWLDQRLAEQGMTVESVVHDGHRRLGAANVTVRNIITSLRLIADVDWNEIVESVSLVDDALAADGDFRLMNFSTRNLYRSAIEDLARRSGWKELDVTHAAIQTAQSQSEPAPDDQMERRGDPGYHLLAGGRFAFEAKIGYRPPWRRWPARLIRIFGIGGYAAATGTVALLLLALPLLLLDLSGYSLESLTLLALVGLIPAVDAAVALVNRAVTFGFGAILLPGLELEHGVPASLRTIVVVPTLLTSAKSIEEQVERLEVHHLASPDGELYYALLSDWADAATEHAEGDDVLLNVAIAGIERLNRCHPPTASGPRFLLFHRRRVWNESNGQWMGWERKRGKLHELNRALRGATDTTFIVPGAESAPPPPDIRYVITLDSDTRLPRDSARRLIGKMAHPLNRPRFDADTGRVVEGYALLQPRVTPSLPVGLEGSPFQRIFSSLSGINPYVAAVSDVYQDLFGEGSYVGKGIYDLDAFEAALAGRVPDSTLLSHDLFEGVFARAGLASDIEVVEEFPARYDVDALRHHRWARGDWQLLPWILGIALMPAGRDRKVDLLPAIGRWKMLDNLRGTLSAPATILALLAGWTLSFDAALIWTGFVLATIVVPTLIPVVAAIPPRRPGITLASHLRTLGREFRLALALSGLIVTFRAHQAWLMSDAIIRTLWRLFVSRKHLLEWVTAAQSSVAPRPGRLCTLRRMAGGPTIAVATMGGAVLLGHGSWMIAGPIAALWLVSPLVAQWVSRSPSVAGRMAITESEAHTLRLTARRTWRYFECYVTAADHWLPPDNFQEDPSPVLARRTSPTNLGLYLLSVASARDFGWIGTDEAARRLETTLATMNALTRFRGHFYNWYDTGDLRPLDPKYVSSVDSGNLAGHLITLANACREWRSRSIDPTLRLAGLADALDLAHETAASLRDGPWTQTVTWRQFDDALAAIVTELRHGATDLDGFARLLPRLANEAETMQDIARALVTDRDGAGEADLLFWVQASLDAIESHRRDLGMGSAATIATRLAAVEETARSMALAMDFGFLLDRQRMLLSIGYLLPEGTLDTNCYDLLASEARLASFFAIAKGDIPARHWFHLGRTVTPVAHSAALVSWSGSMFEYLMPSLVMRAPAGSLIEQTSRLVVRRQIDYAAGQDLPWGISESAYNARDLDLTYQYSNFGIPGLGLKRGLGKNRVVAPYATMLATMVDPGAAVVNLARLERLGARGRFGFYEALDFTPSRLPEGEQVTIVRAYMAHHQGMSIVAIADTLFDGTMRTRFHAEPIIQATELLLQERMPRDVSVAHPWAAEVNSVAPLDNALLGGRSVAYAHQATPATLLLSNGHLTTMITASGSGQIRWDELAVTRWREDSTCDDCGSYVFLRDVRSNLVWSAGLQPSGTEPDQSEIAFHEDRAEFSRHDGSLSTTMTVLVSAEDNSEVRRISIVNSGPRMHEIEITSYAELALAPQAADIAHPAFSKLFVETEYLASAGVLLATRRRRGPEEAEVWAAHLAVIEKGAVGAQTYETDRARFIGRGQTIRTALGVFDGRPLTNSVGIVLDPIFSLRRRVRVAPGETVRIAFWTMVAASRADVLDCVDKHRDSTAFTRAATLAWTQAQVQLHHLGITAAEASLFQRLAGHLIHVAPTLRPSSDVIRRGTGAQAGLWPQGISGDLPIILLRITETDTIGLAREILLAHEYWRMKRLAVDLVILNEHSASYIQDLQTALDSLVRASQPRHHGESEAASPGRVFVLRADLIPAATKALLLAVARVVLSAQRGSLFEQLDRRAEIRDPGKPRSSRPVPLLPARLFAPAKSATPGARTTPPPGLEFFNGLGGFAKEGTEYVTTLGPGQSTPAPWINVVANPSFGFLASVEGGGHTWSINSRENQLTPWSNDPVSDRPGEVIYLRDEESGAVWSPTALPIRDETATYIARHGRGYSEFEVSLHGITADLVQTVPLDDPVKISRLVLRNLSGHPRRLSVTAYVEWVLGPSRAASLPFIATEIDPVTGAMLARNSWRTAFGERIAFFDLGGRQTEWTGDRRDFIGRNRALSAPAALTGFGPLSGKTGAGLDPCGALRVTVDLAPGASIEIVALLGEAAGIEEVRSLIARSRAATPETVRTAVAGFWDTLLGAVQVKTPDRAMDIMLNGWLLYQTVACRLWARSGFYQASGAYGFRDQLQDGMALAATRPEITREHLLRAAARQFIEGDVQHWWLPHSGQGVRTRISDDRVWLAVAVGHYVTTSADRAVLDVQVPFLEGPPLAPGAHDSFFHPTLSERAAPLFEHCALALDYSLSLGVHGLPLIGTGDWNDGMNRVGEDGRGESVWLGWLLYTALIAFAPLAEARDETVRAVAWRGYAATLRASLDREAWDGGWYLRGFFDDGTKLGAAESQECRIDSIAQSWAVLSGAADPERASTAMVAVERELIRPTDQLALLFTPPFDLTPLDPGYIKGYPPGIRENGGQYTHAALWSVMAFAALGQGDKAAGLFALLNPINHARTRASLQRYRLEPYVVAADIYAVSPHVGRGGWSWYSGSAAWMQRAGIEAILGLRREGEHLCLDPCIPRTWSGFGATWLHGTTRYDIQVVNPNGVGCGIASALLDDVAIGMRPLRFPLLDDGAVHRILVSLGCDTKINK
ncbi:GH36-type glycosyl hydrolase domain-containing protein [Magnetospirillum fulvum]|uniref:GH36-type glycosyl hydrolase domain-containing protein n=1 Tax=Magnetospirillum fulvum TaxID=1082 RepID=UPI001FCCE9AF|nr:glucoamylase family protein [Magnetospirillum fulvum]